MVVEKDRFPLPRELRLPVSAAWLHVTARRTDPCRRFRNGSRVIREHRHRLREQPVPPFDPLERSFRPVASLARRAMLRPPFDRSVRLSRCSHIAFRIGSDRASSPGKTFAALSRHGGFGIRPKLSIPRPDPERFPEGTSP
jgi:hypothetical protein